jgi:DNA-binding response OmpR family regulator
MVMKLPLKIRELSDKEKSTVPIIALTASVSNNLSDKIREAGMNDYLSKPYNPKELYSKLREISLKRIPIFKKKALY